MFFDMATSKLRGLIEKKKVPIPRFAELLCSCLHRGRKAGKEAIEEVVPEAHSDEAPQSDAPPESDEELVVIFLILIFLRKVVACV